jgi:hypothetical protein
MKRIGDIVLEEAGRVLKRHGIKSNRVDFYRPDSVFDAVEVGGEVGPGACYFLQAYVDGGNLPTPITVRMDYAHEPEDDVLRRDIVAKFEKAVEELVNG